MSGPDNAHLRGDPRDVMVALAPLHHCARQLKLKPAKVFDEAARGASREMVELAHQFGRRRIRPREWSFMLEETPDGPEYWHIPWGMDLRAIPRGEREAAIRAQTNDLWRSFEER